MRLYDGGVGKMTILVAGNNVTMINELSDKLRKIKKDAKIIVENDALLAGQYSFNNDVDVVFAEINMKRMNGVQLIEFVRHEHPLVLSYLVGSKAEFDESPLIAAEDITNIVVYPLSTEKIRELFSKSEPYEYGR